MKAHTAAIALLSATVVAPTAAQEDGLPSPNLAGIWTFEANLQPACDFNGQARLIPTDEPDRYDCELTANQICPSINVRYTVEQTCQVSVEGDIVTVQSTIQRFLEGEPTNNYLPDNFTLAIQSPSRLEGILLGSSSYEAVWRRTEGAIS